jgi:hypothetical protein
MIEHLNITDLPVELRCKIYKCCNEFDLINFGKAYPKHMVEIIRCFKNQKIFWFDVIGRK